MLTITTLISVLIFIIIVWAAFWICDNIPLPPPVNMFVKAIIGILALIELLHLIGLY